MANLAEPVALAEDRKRSFYIKVQEATPPSSTSSSKGVAIHLAPRPYLPRDRVMFLSAVVSRSESKKSKVDNQPQSNTDSKGEDQLDLFFSATDLSPEQVIEFVELSTAYKPTVS